MGLGKMAVVVSGDGAVLREHMMAWEDLAAAEGWNRLHSGQASSPTGKSLLCGSSARMRFSYGLGPGCRTW